MWLGKVVYTAKYGQIPGLLAISTPSGLPIRPTKIIVTLIRQSGVRMEIVLPYVGGGHYGHPMLLSYTEEVRGSSPFAPTDYLRTKRLEAPYGDVICPFRVQASPFVKHPVE
jgi:hypothetical protein